MTRTDIEVAELTAKVHAARRVAYDEGGTLGLAQVLLCLEGQAADLRIHLRSLRFAARGEPRSDLCHEEPGDKP